MIATERESVRDELDNVGIHQMLTATDANLIYTQPSDPYWIPVCFIALTQISKHQKRLYEHLHQRLIHMATVEF